MANAVFLYFRDPNTKLYTSKDIEVLSKRLTPDNIFPVPNHVIDENGSFIGIFNYNDVVPVKSSSICIGNLINPNADWWKPGAAVPEGSFALFRSNQESLELVTDPLASRTIWYIQTNTVFIASTSQRAIVYFLQDYHPNTTAYPWVLFSGTLGYGLSWDRRIRWLSGDSRLLLNRSSWKINVDKESIRFKPLNLSERDHESQLRTAINYVFEHFSLDYSKWVLPLSGGFDSRTILLKLKNRQHTQTITWGLKSSLNEPENDAYVARSLAKSLGVSHQYFETDISNEPVEQIFNRFLVAGEGRFDQIAGYMDGFKIWEFLYRQGIKGIIRGDEPFGVADPNISVPFEARSYVDCLYPSDYSNLPDIKVFGLEEYSLPDELLQKHNETLETWRDRLYQVFRVGTGNSALNDLKCCYVEIVNPFLTNRIVKKVRNIPDSLRNDKKILKNIAYSISPDIPFAKYEATEKHENIFKTKPVVDLLVKQLEGNYARKLFSDTFLDFILKNISTTVDDPHPRRRIIRPLIKPFIPRTIRKIRMNMLKPKLDINVLAWRVYIICEMNQMLYEDGRALKLSRMG